MRQCGRGGARRARAGPRGAGGASTGSGRVTISRRAAFVFGCVLIAVAIGCQIFNDLVCYKRTVAETLKGLWFPLVPLVPSVVFLFSANPLRAAGSAGLVIPFYLFAYYVDCVAAYESGGASMVYVTVLVYGLAAALVGGLLTGPVCGAMGVRVNGAS